MKNNYTLLIKGANAKINGNMTINRILKNFFLISVFYFFIIEVRASDNPMSGNYTIGEENADYLSFNSALDDLAERFIVGDITFIVKPGIYNEEIYINWIYTTGPGTLPHIHTHSVTFTSETGKPEDVVITAGGSTVDAVIRLHSHAHRVTFENMTVIATNSSTTPILITGSREQRFKGLILEGFKPGIASWGGAYSRGLYIENCIFRGGGISLLGAASTMGLQDLHIVGNIFEKSGISLNSLRGFFSIRNNYITHSNVGIRVQGSPFFGEIVNNYVRVESGSTFQSMILHTLDSVVVFHNTFKAISPGGAVQIWGDSKINLKNNILYTTRDRLIDVKQGTLYSDYNAFYSVNDPAFMFPDGTYVSMQDYIDATGLDVNSYFINPEFNLNAETQMGSMVPGIPDLMDAGTNLFEWVPVDFFGFDRSSTPSIGAIEYDGTFMLPVTPDLVGPADMSVKIPRWPLLRWQGKGVANYFELQVSENEGFDEVQYSASGIDNSRHMVRSGLSPQNDYWWRVRAVNGLGASEWTPAWKFTTYDGPGASSEVDAGNENILFTDLNVSITFVDFDADLFFAATVFTSDEETIPGDSGAIGDVFWTIDQDGATNFTAKVCFDIPSLDSEADPDLILIWKRGGAGDDWVEQTVVLTSAEDGAVKACVEVNSFSDFIITQASATNSSLLLTGVASHLKHFQNFPNPFNGSTMISYELNDVGHLLVEVYNISGQRIAKIIDEFHPAGVHETLWGSGIEPGVYYLRVVYTGSGKQESLIRPVVVVK